MRSIRHLLQVAMWKHHNGSWMYLLGALAQACPDRIPAASQGTMNNVSIGGWDPERNRFFTYYETIGGGMGASSI